MVWPPLRYGYTRARVRSISVSYLGHQSVLVVELVYLREELLSFIRQSECVGTRSGSSRRTNGGDIRGGGEKFFFGGQARRIICTDSK